MLKVFFYYIFKRGYLLMKAFKENVEQTPERIRTNPQVGLNDEEVKS
jgi:hypothetical protein